MCLIPTQVIRDLGLALPVFIKWDDAEYGLRARDAGYPTVSMPGVAAWHVTWQDKTDSVDWQTYYHTRNRLVTALLHSPFDHGGRVIPESGEIQILHLLSMQYSAADLRLRAIEDILSGPATCTGTCRSGWLSCRRSGAASRDAQARGRPGGLPAAAQPQAAGRPGAAGQFLAARADGGPCRPAPAADGEEVRAGPAAGRPALPGHGLVGAVDRGQRGGLRR